MNVPIKKLDFFMLGLLVFFLPFMFFINVVIQLNVSVSDFILLIVLVWVLLLKENKQIISEVLQKYRMIIIYMGILIYFCIFSMMNYLTNTYVDFPYGVSAILKLSFNFLYVLVFLTYLEKYKEDVLNFLLRWWKRAAVFVAFLCIVTVILYENGFDRELTLGGRAQGTFTDPNMAATYLIISFSLVALANLLNQKKIFLSLPMLLVMIALFLTASRGGTFGFVLGILVVLFFSLLSGRIKQLYFFFMAILILITIIIWINQSSEILSFSLERVSSVGTEEDGTSYRLFLWELAYHMWTENLFIGVGIGQFIPYSPEMLGYTVTSIPHNTYLTFLSETGILGFFAFVWFPLFLFGKLLMELITNGGKSYFYILIGFIAVAVQAFTINVENFRFTWIFLTIAYFVIRNKPNLLALN